MYDAAVDDWKFAADVSLSGGNVTDIDYVSLNEIMYDGKTVCGGVLRGDTMGSSVTKTFQEIHTNGYAVTADCFLNTQISALETDSTATVL